MGCTQCCWEGADSNACWTHAFTQQFQTSIHEYPPHESALHTTERLDQLRRIIRHQKPDELKQRHKRYDYRVKRFTSTRDPSDSNSTAVQLNYSQTLDFIGRFEFPKRSCHDQLKMRDETAESTWDQLSQSTTAVYPHALSRCLQPSADRPFQA
jgi:hypothetical protein